MIMKKHRIRFNIVTIFPNIFKDYFSTSIIKWAQKKGFVRIKIYDLRKFTTDKHKTVDDKPYGGGPGMVLKAAPIYKAIRSILENSKGKSLRQGRIRLGRKNSKIVLLTPQGKQFNQKIAQRYSKLDSLILICGHYEGIDARVEKFVDEKISIGPYVLTGGELPAMIIVDAVTRLISGVIKKESLLEESFSIRNSSKSVIRRGADEARGEYPQYTRPEVLTIKDKYDQITTLRVPKVLLSGNHQKIKAWRERHTKLLNI